MAMGKEYDHMNQHSNTFGDKVVGLLTLTPYAIMLVGTLVGMFMVYLLGSFFFQFLGGLIGLDPVAGSTLWAALVVAVSIPTAISIVRDYFHI